jgi:hypothetical protein
MSHITTMTAQVKDLDAVERAVKELGGTLVRNQQTHTYYGGAQGKCDHAIKLPGTSYEIGLVLDQQTGAYKLAYDSFCPVVARVTGTAYGGGAKFVDGQKTLMQLYGVHKTALEMRRRGYSVQTLTKGNQMKVVVTGNL